MQLIKRIFNRLGIYTTSRRQINGQAFRIPLFNKLGFANLTDFEPWMETILKKTGGEKAAFLDVGANVGQTLLKWKSIFPQAPYIGLEPNADCVHYINQLIAQNNIKQAQILPVALSDRTRLSELFLSSTDPSDSAATMIGDFRAPANHTRMPVVSVPFDLINQTGFDLIKIDVEGSEADIIASIFAKELDKKPLIVCEILPVYDANVNPKRLERQEKLEATLHNAGYVIYRVRKGASVSLELVNTIGVHGDMTQCDYVFIPQEKEHDTLAKFQ